MGTRSLDNTLRDDGTAPSVTIPAALVTGSFADPPETVAPTASASRYAELGVLGEGGMGRVHLCRDERIGREVAMKVILPELQAHASTRARFIREASVQGQLEHPSIVPVHDLGVTPDGATFFTMKRVYGHTLEEVLTDLESAELTTSERFSSRRLLGAFVNVCLAVDFAHSRGVVHRDLKPANLMLGDFGEIYLLDWGIAKLADESLDPERVERGNPIGETPVPKTADGAIVGTLVYMAPEQIMGKPASVRSDVFALGAVLFEILAGAPLRPHDTTFASMAKGKHDARFSVRCPERDVAPELEAICVRATAADVGERFPSARLLAEAVERFLEGDRDVVRRRELAAAHVSAAREILAGSTSIAGGAGGAGVMRQLGSALALDPENVEARKMVVEALTTVPRELPAEIADALERRAQESVVLAARMWPAMLVTWLCFAPILYLVGIRDFRAMGVGFGLMAAATVFGILRARRTSGGTRLEYIAFATAALAMVVVGRPFGPFVVVPTLLGTFATALQLHPRRRGRLVSLGIVVTAIVGAVLFELSGVLPRGGEITASTLLVSSSTADRNVPLTLVILLMNVTATVMTAYTVSGVRAQLTKAEERLLVHAWQVQGMMPTNVAARSSERAVPVARRLRKTR